MGLLTCPNRRVCLCTPLLAYLSICAHRAVRLGCTGMCPHIALLLTPPPWPSAPPFPHTPPSPPPPHSPSILHPPSGNTSIEVTFADTTEPLTDVNLNVSSIDFNGTTLTLGGPYGLSFLGGALYYTSEFIISQTTRNLAGVRGEGAAEGRAADGGWQGAGDQKPLAIWL